ncbi:MAG: 4Fe-4S binding protein, partial [Oscillospiraceae bacterium]|nr:4Fe-4S binding protein [Oscillospiraceae bacterium]
NGKYVINPAKCIECGTCSYSCPVGAAQPGDDM